MNLAPNGKPSKLTPEQYELVRTPAFKNWFGDWENNPEGASKVVDENGEPKVSYHGSSGFYDGTIKGWGTKFTKFSTNRLIFATNNYKVAEHFGQVGEYFVNIKNPFILNDNSHSWERLNENELIEKLGEFDFIQFVNEYFDEEFYDIDEYWQSEYDSEPTMIDIDSFGEYLKNKFSYDGIIAYGIEETPAHIEADDYISFEPTQIKLADGSNTTFDSSNTDIRFKDGGRTKGLIKKPSNLTPEQYKLVRTPEFKEWFGDWENNSFIKKHKGHSEIHPFDTISLDENGEPKVWYRSANYEYNEIEQEFIYLGNKKSYVKQYGKPKDFFVYPYKTIFIDNEDLERQNLGIKFDYLTEYISDENGIPRKGSAYNKLKNIYKNQKEPLAVWEYFTLVGNNEKLELFKEWFQEFGFDSICYWETGKKNNFGKYPVGKIILYFGEEYLKLADGTNKTFDSENPDIRFDGGGNVPAPKKDQVKGSAKNKKGSSKDIKSAKSIKLADKTIKAIQNKIDEHNEKHPKKKINLASAKAVVRRGMGAYSSSHRPTIKGGKPNSRVAWGLARLNAFIYKIVKGKSKSGKYSQDNDLIKELGYKVQKFEGGGESNKIDYKAQEYIDMLDALNYHPNNPKKERLKRYADILLNQYGIMYQPESVRLADENKVLDKYVGQTNVTTNKGLELVLDIYKKNIEATIGIDAYNEGIYVGGLGFSIDLRKGQLRVGGASVKEEYQRKGVYRAMIDFLVKIAKENNLKFYRYGRSDMAQAFWKNYDPKENLQFEYGGSTETKYQFRDIGGGIVYYKKENGGLWEFIKKDEFDKNANQSNIELFKIEEMKNVIVNINMYWGDIDARVDNIEIQAPKSSFDFNEWAEENDFEYEMWGDDELIDTSWGFEYIVPFDEYRDYLWNEKNKSYDKGGQTPAQQEKIAKVMGEFKRGELNTSYGTKVTDDKQAIAIALSEADNYEGGGMFDLGTDMMSKANVDASDVYDFMYDKLDEGKRFESAEEVFDAINERYATGKVYDYSKKSVEAGFKSFKKDNYAEGGLMGLKNKIDSANPFPDYTKNERDMVMENYTQIPTKEAGGVIEGQLHSECNDDTGCGEKFDVGGVGNVIEAERDEAVIVSSAFQDTNRYKFKGTPSQIASALNVMGGGKNFDRGATIDFNGKIINTDKIKKETNDTDVKDDIESGSVIINRRSMFDNTIYEVEGTPKQIASAINSVNGYGVVIEDGATIKEA